MISEMFRKGQVLTFPECKLKHRLQESEKYHYTQIRLWGMHLEIKLAATRDLTEFEKWIRPATGSRGVTSPIYTLIREFDSPHEQRFYNTGNCYPILLFLIPNIAGFGGTL